MTRKITIAEQVKHIAEQVMLLENRMDSPMYGPMLEEEAGCRIKPISDDKTYWQIEAPWYVSQKSAEDLRRIVGFKRQYKERNPLWHRVFFPNFRENARVLYFWV